MDKKRERIKWAPRIRPQLIKRLYESDALGFQDIDRLVHSFHWSLKENLPARSAANNLIEGEHDQVVEFLDKLAGLDNESKESWRETMQEMMRRRKGK